MPTDRLHKRAASSRPAPISIEPSHHFEGANGPWSTFSIQIGTPPQTVRVLPSMQNSQTWAVLPAGCTKTDQANCTTARGGVFQPNSSSSWNQNIDTANGLFPLLLDSNLGYSGNGYYGFDTVALGGQGGPSLEQQAVAGIATKDYFLGMFGLSPQASILPDSTRPLPNYISQLNNSGLIPSLSWSYTAGNNYRPGPMYGSLVLGGYDSSRFEPNNLSFPLDKANPGKFTVYVNEITLTTGGNTTVLPATNNSVTASIDTTTPMLWLPLYLCKQFETAFGLTWNNDLQGYPVNDTLHEALQSQDTSVVISLGNSSSVSGPSVSITLPYGAFDLIIDSTSNYSRYFPLTRADNDTQYTLGRTFLQEA